MTAEALRHPHASLKLNPRIANAFYLRGIIESWGRGTLRMMELTTASGLPEPEFVNTNHSFTVRFLPSRYVAPMRVETNLSPIQQEILQSFGTRGPLTLGELRDALPGEPARRTVQDNLQILRALGLVEMEGVRRWARWKLSR